MASSEIAKLDSKGRILIPASFRAALRLGEDSEVLAHLDEMNAAITLTPVGGQGLVSMTIGLSDAPGSLARTAKVLADEGVDLVSSESRSMHRGQNAEWRVLASADSLGDLARLKRRLMDAGATSFSSKKVG